MTPNIRLINPMFYIFRLFNHFHTDVKLDYYFYSRGADDLCSIRRRIVIIKRTVCHLKNAIIMEGDQEIHFEFGRRRKIENMNAIF